MSQVSSKILCGFLNHVISNWAEEQQHWAAALDKLQGTGLVHLIEDAGIRILDQNFQNFGVETISSVHSNALAPLEWNSGCKR